MKELVLSKEKFTREFEDALRKYAGPGTEISMHRLIRNNGITDTGCLVRMKENAAAPSFSLEECYRAWQSGENTEDIARRILAEAEVRAPECSHFDPAEWENYESISDHLALRLISAEKNRELLRDVPFRRTEDMALVCYYLADAAGDSRATVLIHNSALRIWNISADRLFRDAWKSMQRLLPVKIMTITEALGMASEETADAMEKSDEMYVISNDREYFGAVCVLYPEVLQTFAVRKKRNFYVLPSSIHEMILVPDEPGLDYSGLASIVEEVNRTEVKPEEVLTDSVYYYDRFRSCLIRAGI